MVTGKTRKLGWAQLYSEAELYKAAVRLYTTPLFSWRKALSRSTDQHTLYDFARHGLKNLDAIHRALSRENFHFRPGIALRHNFNGKERTLYIYPWEERVVDVLVYRLLNKSLDGWFSPHSYAYRHKTLGLDPCQRRIAHTLARATQPLYVMRRDVREYFASIDHEILTRALAALIEPGDYLLQLLEQRVKFTCLDDGQIVTASRGIPFGTAVACVLANIYLTELDRRMGAIEDLAYFRYADDCLMIASDREHALAARWLFDLTLGQLHLGSNPNHQEDLLFSIQAGVDADFRWERRFRYLGLEFRAGGSVGLSRDKFRKLCNLFRFAFRRRRATFRRIYNPVKRVRLAIDLARRVIDGGARNVAIIDYYLKHTDDEKQLRLLDRWLAEEVLFLAFGRGHRKSHFHRLDFKKLRAMGLPSLVHRRRLIRHGHIESPFFVWKNHQLSRGSKGAAARLLPQARRGGSEAFSPPPEAAAIESLREREELPVDGRY